MLGFIVTWFVAYCSCRLVDHRHYATAAASSSRSKTECVSAASAHESVRIFEHPGVDTPVDELGPARLVPRPRRARRDPAAGRARAQTKMAADLLRQITYCSQQHTELSLREDGSDENVDEMDAGAAGLRRSGRRNDDVQLSEVRRSEVCADRGGEWRSDLRRTRSTRIASRADTIPTTTEAATSRLRRH